MNKKHKKILATITEDELNELTSIGCKEDIEPIIDALVLSLGKLKQRKINWWTKIKEKYKIEETEEVRLNNFTRKIYKLKEVSE